MPPAGRFLPLDVPVAHAVGVRPVLLLAGDLVEDRAAPRSFAGRRIAELRVRGCHRVCLVLAGKVEVIGSRIGEPQAAQERRADPAPEPVLRRVELVVDDHDGGHELGVRLRDDRLPRSRPGVIEALRQRRLRVPEASEEAGDSVRRLHVPDGQGPESTAGSATGTSSEWLVPPPGRRSFGKMPDPGSRRAMIPGHSPCERSYWPAMCAPTHEGRVPIRHPFVEDAERPVDPAVRCDEVAADPLADGGRGLRLAGGGERPRRAVIAEACPRVAE